MKKLWNVPGAPSNVYPSIARFYNISYVRNDEKPRKMFRVEWDIKNLMAMKSGHGVYFLHTNVRTFDEKTTWDYYNLIGYIKRRRKQSPYSQPSAPILPSSTVILTTRFVCLFTAARASTLSPTSHTTPKVSCTMRAASLSIRERCRFVR